MLLKFTIVCLSQRLDGFLIELPGDIYGASVQVYTVKTAYVGLLRGTCL